MQAKKTVPFNVSNYTKQHLQPITPIKKCNYKKNDSSCALACQNQRSIWFWLHFSLVLSFVQAKERTSSLYQDKEKKGTKKYSLLV
jgi:hypothetical protein